MSKVYRFHASVLGEIGKQFENKTLISPLQLQDKYREIGPAKFAGVEKIISEMEPLVKKLAIASFFGRYQYSEGGDVIETTVYYDSEGILICGIYTESDELVVLDPNIVIANDLDQIIELTGGSVIRNNTFDEVLTGSESLALSSMMDLYRRHMYLCIGKGQVIEPISCSAEEVYQEITNEGSQGIMWLTYIIQQSVTLDMTYDLANITSALENLTSRGLFLKKGDVYTIGSELEELALRLHYPDNIMVVDCGYSDDDRSYFMNFISAQFGLKDIIMIDAGEDSINMSTVSGAYIVEVLKDFMTDPKRFFDHEVQTSASSSSDLGKVSHNE